MATLRSGSSGVYYGSLYSESAGLTEDEMKVNATYIMVHLSKLGWTKNAIAGMLGNMQAESSINPGRWQSEDVGNTSLGYGLVQWTPATKYFNYCSENGLSDPSEMDNNLSRIVYELANNIQWIATDEYNLSFEEFSKSTESPEYLASAFLKCYERAGVEVEDTRRSNAKAWFEYLADIPGTTTSPSIKVSFKRKGRFNFIVFNKRKRITE